MTVTANETTHFRMVDVSEKKDTLRRARASGYFYASRETIKMIHDKRIPKGDALSLAEVAGVQAAKKTSEILPLCHPLLLDTVKVSTEVLEDRIKVSCEVKVSGKTGVEMEALCGVSAALLSIYDLTKIVDPVLRISDIQLELKEGGASGCWKNPNISAGNGENSTTAAEELPLSGCKVGVLTVSDRCSKGTRQDLSGPAICDQMIKLGATEVLHALVPDDKSRIQSLIIDFIEKHCSLVISTGGTGLSPCDVTPEALEELRTKFCGRELSGLGELLRHAGASQTEMAYLSRSTALSLKDSLIIALPGSLKAVTEGIETLKPLLGHALHTLRGGGHD